MEPEQTIPITVLALHAASADTLQRLAAGPENHLIATGSTMARAGLLGLIRVGRATVTAPDVTSRTPGCGCCRIRVDLVAAVRHAILRRAPARRLIVVVDQASPSGDGVDDPAGDIVTCMHTLLADSEIERLARIDGLIVETDARTASTRLACGLDLWDGHTEAALAIADRIILTSAALLTAQARLAIEGEVRRLNSIGTLVFDGAAASSGADLVDLDAWEQAPAIGVHTDVPDQAADVVRRRPAIETVVLTRGGVLDPDATDDWLDRVVAQAPSRLLRFQAVLRVSPTEPRVCVRGSRSVMRSQPERARSAAASRRRQRVASSVVILVGEGLDSVALNEAFGSIRASTRAD